MPVPTTFAQLSETQSSNSPVGSEIVGPNMNQYIQQAYAFIRMLYDGQSMPLAAMNFNGQRLTNVANGVANSDAATVGQISAAYLPLIGGTITGSLTVTGTISGANLTGTSDERLKTDWRPMARDFLERMAAVLHGTFSWESNGIRSAGVGAQSLRAAFPEVVHEDANGKLSVAYGNAALVTVLELIPIVLRLLDCHGEES